MNLVQPHFEWDDVAVATGRIDPHDFAMARDVAERLFALYPDHHWYVAVDHEAGSIVIRNLALSSTHGYLLHLAKYSPMGPEGRQKAVRQAGGEILERFRVRRGTYSMGDYDGLIQKARFATGA